MFSLFHKKIHEPTELQREDVLQYPEDFAALLSQDDFAGVVQW